MYQTAWRLYSKMLDTVLDDNPDDFQPIGQPRANRELCLFAYYIDYNGHSYGPVERTWEIKYYEGEKDITTLEIYPMRFLKDCDKMKTKLHVQGIAFQRVIRKRHLYYDGWTLAHGPTGNGQGGDSDSESERNDPEHIEGDVIIDFVEGYKAKTSIKMPTFLDSPMDDSDWPTGDDALLIRCFKDGPQSEILGEIKEITQRNELVGNYLKSRHKKQSKLLQTWEATYVTELEEDDLILLPRRAVAYAFRERKFVMLDVEVLHDVPAPKNVFGDLKIDGEHKRMVKSLVKAHFRKQNLQKDQPNAGLNQDLIRGKGSGLFILLHGVPGVGKTATAEAVAQANKKPLFVITCGDLGFSPKEVDSSLRDIFRLAHLWDCVLLLDEADIFLTRREHNDLQRNALVSVFLRVLEYYSGILFLTTNRVGILDEAFKSRIHVSLYYPPLSKEQTLAIFEVNIRKLYDIEKEKQELQNAKGPQAPKRLELIIDAATIRDYANWHYDNHEPHQRWNGRQIRNAFQIAHSLADFDLQRTSLDDWEDNDADIDAYAENKGADSGQQAASILDFRHFKIVAKVIEKFERYLFDAMQGNTDNDLNRTNMTRDDAHDPYMWDQGPSYHPPFPRTQRQGNPSMARRPRQEFAGYTAGPGQPQDRRPSQQPRPSYRPPPQEYQPPDAPQQESQSRPKQRPAPQGMAQTENARLRARGSPSKVTPRSKPALDRRDDSGYSRWSTTTSGPSPDAFPNDEYPPDEDEQMAGGHQHYVKGDDQYYGEYEEEYQTNGRS
ncbi:hypothetical protein LSUB1_G000711 [Lachnellula subtilissima]|uniref:AAA+ ATPase domain-containing protein n=1 Tax=Lachnellula subtilissima TaxID=602034 RepID=A0A8H8S298_9HELO|nr:hypothetical protein LSUB1_G000711 [Lachnellula subtilissima]